MLLQSKDLQGIRQLKTVMGKGFDGVEEALVNQVLGVGKEGTVSAASIRGQLNQMPKETASTILGAGKIKQLRALATQIENVDATAIQNPFFKQLLRSNPAKVVGLVVKPGETKGIDAVAAEQIQDRIGVVLPAHDDPHVDAVLTHRWKESLFHFPGFGFPLTLVAFARCVYLGRGDSLAYQACDNRQRQSEHGS